MIRRGPSPLVDSSSLVWRPSALVERAENDGYLFLPRLLPADRVNALREVALEAAHELGWLDPAAPRSAAVTIPDLALAPDRPEVHTFLGRVMGHPLFAELRAEPALQSVVESLLPGPRAELVGDMCRVVSGNALEHTTAAHQDRHYVKGDGWLWIAWLPLGDCPLSLGPLAVLPGSHRQGLLTHRARDRAHEERRTVDVSADAVWHASDLASGDVVFFSGLTVHRALPHVGGGRLRFSVDYRFQPC
jgi:hypothetical protein